MPPLNYRIYSFSQFRADFVYCLQKKNASHGAGQACFWDFVGIVVYNLGFNCLTLPWAQSGCESVPLCPALSTFSSDMSGLPAGKEKLLFVCLSSLCAILTATRLRVTLTKSLLSSQCFQELICSCSSSQRSQSVTPLKFKSSVAKKG